ncbi:Crinkler (CRN) family protein [Phytophthora palmivora]|uniref:Crinkler (CRN) family protein n=1 Tax=Phytophthora palmivora TaxID=4796 RepID=A0A2P4XJI2_9STRA|nr:Crinkler (CRN) family protein [Phytophthora palmivora]
MHTKRFYVGALFGSTGFIDFTVHCGDDFWGIELLRDGSNLDEHIDRFAPGGPYSLLELSDYCLVDFRRVSSMGDMTMPTITTDLNHCAKLYVVCYDPTLAHVSILNAQSVWNIL